MDQERRKYELKKQHELISRTLEYKQTHNYFEMTDLFQELVFLKDIIDLGKLIQEISLEERDLELFCLYLNREMHGAVNEFAIKWRAKK